VRALGNSPDGELIDTVSASARAVRVYDAQTRRRIAVLHDENEIVDASFDPGSRLLLTVSDDNGAHLWDAGRAG